MKKRIIGSLLATLMTVSVMGQVSKTLSPYSQFGFGTLTEQSQGFNRAMSGLSIGMRNGKYVNVQNPASYSSIDSLTMIFDAGVSGQITNFTEGNKKVNAKTAGFDYAVAAFRVLPKLGATIGIVPFSNIGYNYNQAAWIGEIESGYYGKLSDNYYQLSYSGDGGLSQTFLGLGWEMLQGLSVGANFSYFWGSYTRSSSTVMNDTYANTLLRTYTSTINTWKLDLGVQYSTKINKDDQLTVGAIAGIGHKMGANANLSMINTNALTGVTTSTTDSVVNAFELPYTFGAGVSLTHKGSLTVGADYVMQRWSATHFPQLNTETNRYESTSGLLKDRHKITVGAEWIPNPDPMARGFFKHIHYRVGASYATPYYKIGSKDGPKELCVSAGFGIPIVNSWNNRTTLNISAQWIHTGATDMIKENSFRINIGLTFNERWFAKWKVD